MSQSGNRIEVFRYNCEGFENCPIQNAVSHQVLLETAASFVFSFVRQKERGSMSQSDTE